MSKKAIKPMVLKNLYKVGFATPANFLPFITHTKNYNSAKNHPLRIFKYLQEKGFVEEIKITNRIYNLKSVRDTFYTITEQGMAFLEVQGKRTEKLSVQKIMHEKGLTDVLLGFIYCFPEYEVIIKRNKRSSGPDAIISLIKGKDQYDFIIEFERYRTWDRIRKEKLEQYRNFNYKINKLSKHTKILLIYAHDDFNVFKTPIEWTDSILEFQKHQFKQFIDYTKGLPPIFLFASYANYQNLADTVWKDINGIPRNLIQ